MRFILLFLLLMIMCINNVQARPVVADLGIRSIDIDHNFSGINILMFGARNDVGKLVVVVRGPEKNYIVRKKSRIAGVWVNSESVEFNKVPGFYYIASTDKPEALKNSQLLKSLGIGVDNIHMVNVKTDLQESNQENFKEALIRHKLHSGLYSSKIDNISFEETLFRTVLRFPKNIERGWYTVEVYLFNDGILSAVQSTPVKVSKVGFEAFLFDMAHKNSFIYGLICTIIALSIGWIATRILGRR